VVVAFAGVGDAAAPRSADTAVGRLCTATDTRSTVTRLVAAWNEGRLDARRYFARRHALRDHIRIRFFRFNGSDAREDGSYGHFEYKLEPSAADYRRGEPFDAVGKDAVNCSLARTAIAVWSMAGAG
jgi:hypothetical protein